MVWLNGHNLGRFWKIGPQQTLFVPGAWLKKGSNEVVVLDLEVPGRAVIKGLKQPMIDKINPDASLLVRRAGQQLDLSNEPVAFQGTFNADKNWKEINFDQNFKGRYFCIEALNSQSDTDVNTSLAELQILGKDKKTISTQKWKVVYADSEEMTTANHRSEERRVGKECPV